MGIFLHRERPLLLRARNRAYHVPSSSPPKHLTPLADLVDEQQRGWRVEAWPRRWTTNRHRFFGWSHRLKHLPRQPGSAYAASSAPRLPLVLTMTVQSIPSATASAWPCLVRPSSCPRSIWLSASVSTRSAKQCPRQMSAQSIHRTSWTTWRMPRLYSATSTEIARLLHMSTSTRCSSHFRLLHPALSVASRVAAAASLVRHRKQWQPDRHTHTDDDDVLSHVLPRTLCDGCRTRSRARALPVSIFSRTHLSAATDARHDAATAPRSGCSPSATKSVTTHGSSKAQTHGKSRKTAPLSASTVSLLTEVPARAGVCLPARAAGTLPMYSVLIEHPDEGLILWETGPGKVRA